MPSLVRSGGSSYLQLQAMRNNAEFGSQVGGKLDYYCLYEFVHLAENIYVPAFNMRLGNVKITDSTNKTLDIFKLNKPDCILEVYSNDVSSSNYRKLLYSILLTYEQAMKIIYCVNRNLYDTGSQIINIRMITGDVYYKSRPEIERIGIDNIAHIKIQQILLHSKLISEADLLNMLDSTYKMSGDVIKKLHVSSSQIYKLFGKISHKEFINVMFVFKTIFDYNSRSQLLSKPPIPLSNITKLIEDTCAHIIECVDSNIADKYRSILCDKELINSLEPKIAMVYSTLISHNNDNIIKSLSRNKKYLLRLWELIKYAKESDKEFEDYEC